MTQSKPSRYTGVFPVAPTVFDSRGEVDLDGQKRCTDFMIEAGSTGICILANWSEQFALTDEEREQVMRCVLDHVAGRVPVIVVYAATLTGGQLACDEESLEAKFFAPDAIPWDELAFRSTHDALREFLA